MAATAQDLIDAVNRYFDAVDANDVPGTLKELTPDCTLEIVTAGAKHQGHAAIQAMFERRLTTLVSGWHGERVHTTDPARGFSSCRFRAKSEETSGAKRDRYNINFFEFDGRLIRRIQVWMVGDNTLK